MNDNDLENLKLKYNEVCLWNWILHKLDDKEKDDLAKFVCLFPNIGIFAKRLGFSKEIIRSCLEQMLENLDQLEDEG